ncbi:MAG: hypothetical protein H6636_02500 [Anaerolineales bacterium]|nr:hypothetical protein [Anaerolineales bacterium]
MSLKFSHDTLILDATCVISLYASGKIDQILKTIPPDITISAYVKDHEVLRIYDNALGHHLNFKKVDLNPLIKSNLITIVTIDTENEAEILATLASKIIGRGEAETGAIAINRNWAIVTDDKKARKVFRELAPHIQLVYTLELMKHWAETNSISAESITEALLNIQERASYRPWINHPLYSWWYSYSS